MDTQLGRSLRGQQPATVPPMPWGSVRSLCGGMASFALDRRGALQHDLASHGTAVGTVGHARRQVAQFETPEILGISANGQLEQSFGHIEHVEACKDASRCRECLSKDCPHL
eukprot:4479448-Amphidinium_carterae.1